MSKYLVKKVSAAATLKAMPIGEEIEIPYNLIKTETLRNAASRLNAKGRKYVVSTDGITPSTKIIRLK